MTASGSTWIGVIAVALASATPALAAEKEDVAGFIFHHVTDSNEYEWEIPLNDGPNPTIALPTIMIPIRAGAHCGPMFTGFHLVHAGEGGAHGEAHRPGLGEGCLDLSVTKHTLMLFLGSALLLAVFLIGTHRNRSELIPRGRLANALELLVVFVRDELAVKNIGPAEGPRYTAFLLTIFFFILFLNFLGLLPWMATATANIGVTVALAALTFVLTQVAAIRAAGFGGYLKHLTGGVHWLLWPIMIPVEVLGLFTKPFALTIRLFANMLAGHVVIFFLLGLIFIMGSVAWAVIAVPFAFAIYLLEIFVAFVQAYIFTMLSALFIGMGVAMGHHDEEHPGEAEGARSHDHGAGHLVGG
ncbi:MAG TPA: F0F1 ATP synthase subunit A [Myxococcaceae bacterium]|nr:F0F1 ATP synthase subunit A [Myxococcaceae bacterium]